MKIALLEIDEDRNFYINKDVMGGFGMKADFGHSILSRILAILKKKSVNFPVYTLADIAAIFKKSGHQVKYFKNELPLDFDVVFIPSSIVDFRNELKWAERIKKTSSAKVGFFGPFASTFPGIFLEVADFVLLGEPEEASARIANGLEPKGKIVSQPGNLENLPFPAWEIFDWQKFSYRPMIKAKPFFIVLSSRGCVFNCFYCPYKAFYGNFRSRNPQSIIEELIFLKKNFGMKAVQFRDPIFTADRERVIRLCELILQSGLIFQWGCETHVNYLDKELVEIMKKAGLKSLNIGVESADKELLRDSTRISANAEKEIEIVKYCQQKNINVAAFYILGLPDDILQSMKNTLNYAKSLNTLVAQFFVCTPFPNTKFYQSVKDRIYENDWEKFNSF
ncbi:MAG: hypothetical protein A2174_03090, partial [Candidatus Portnoybacteria bacterium RBG_13_41_18]